jgi:hypothetical protein
MYHLALKIHFFHSVSWFGLLLGSGAVAASGDVAVGITHEGGHMETAELANLGLPPDAEEAAPQALATGGEASPDAASPTPGTPTLDQLARLRDVLVAANPEAVPEMIGGADLDALLASVEPARAAYARIKDAAAHAALAAIPRGGGTRALDPAAYADLSPEAKIAFALSVGSGQ